MRFRTEIPPFRAPFSLSPDHPAVMLGSCFSDHITSRMRSCLWRAVNPFGTLFNPISIAAALRLSLLPEEEALECFRASLFGENPVNSRFFGSKMSAADPHAAQARFLEASRSLMSALDSAQALFITFGTAWVYALSGEPEVIVGNCHKQPASLFTRRRLSVEEITDEWIALAALLRERVPGLKLVFTVSPVRHLKDGFTGNSRSKAVLLLATEQLTSAIPDSFYFPAYELINDDLRDYRFYNPDLVHPSPQSVEYVWEHFCAAFLDKEAMETLREGGRIAAGYAHRPIIADAEADAHRLETLSASAARFIERHPGMLIPEGF